MSNELKFVFDLIGVIVAVFSATTLLRLLLGFFRAAYEGRNLEVRRAGNYKRPVAIEVEKPKLKNEPDDGYGIWLTDEEAQELGLGYDWREQIQQMRDGE